MPDAIHHRRRARRLLRRFALIICLIAAGLAATGYHLTRSDRIASLAGGMIERLTGAEVEIDSASFTLDGTVMLHGLTLSVPGLEGEGARLFDAETALLKLDASQAIWGKFRAREMLLLRPTLSLTEIQAQQFNYEQLRRERRVPDDLTMPDLPHIYVRDGRVRYGEVHDGEYHNVGSLHVGGRLDPDDEQAGLYHFELAPQPEDYAADPTSPLASVVHPTLEGRFDLEQLEVRAELADFAFVDPHRNMLPRQIRRWWDLFEPSGSLPNITFDYDPVTGPKATVHVEGVSLSLPQLNEVDYEARLSDVSGTFHFDAEEIRVQNLVGEIEGLQYRINGIIDGYRTESPFQLSLDTRPFRIPEEPHFMPALPLDVQEVFHQLSPVGWMRVSLVLRRSDADAAIDYNGSARILSGQDLVTELERHPRAKPSEVPLDPNAPQFSSTGQYHHFPYPIHDASGFVTFNSERIEVRRLTGNTSGGGKVTLAGTIAPPSPEARVDLTVTAEDLPVDEALKEALGEQQRRIVEMFFHEPSAAPLRDAGHFIGSSEQDTARNRQRDLTQRLAELPDDAAVRETLAAELEQVDAAGDRPRFDLGGRVDAEIHFERALADGDGEGNADIRARIDLTGLNVVFEHFPYPLTVTGGELVTSSGGLDFREVTARGLNGGSASLDGYVETPDDENAPAAVPDLALKADDMPMDALLLDVLPADHRDWLSRLNPSGTFDLDGHILHDPRAPTTPPIGFDVAVDFADATLAPGKGRYPLTDASGRLRLTLHELQIERFHASHDDARLQLTGRAQFGHDQPDNLELSGSGTDMRLEDDVLDLLAPAVGESPTLETFWSERRPAGLFDTHFHYRTETDDDTEPFYQLQMLPQTLAFDHHDQRIHLQQVNGSVTIEPEQIHLRQLAGQFDDDNRFAADGQVTLGTERSAALSLEVEGSGLSPTLEHLAPDAVGSILREASFKGDYHLRVPDLEVTLHEDGTHDARLDATLDLEAASFDLGLPVSDLHASLDLSLEQEVGDDYPAIHADVRAPRLRLANRALTDLNATLRNPQGGALIGIPELNAKLAQGSITGRGSASLDEDRFQLELALADARLRDLLSPADEDAGSTDPASPATLTLANVPADNPNEPTHVDVELPPDAETDTEQIDGAVSLSLAIEGGWASDRTLRGRGDLDVRDANLRGFPLAMGLLQVTHLTLPAEQRFQRAISSYYIRGDRIVFEQLQLDAPGMRIGGSGTVDYRTRDLDLTLTTSNPSGLDLGPVTTLIDGFRDQLVTLRVTGTAEKPRLQVRQLDGFSEAFQDVFGE